FLASQAQAQLTWVFVAYTLVGIGAAAYSPAKYGIVTEMLKPELLVKGNSWIEGLTVLSIIVGTVMGGVLVYPDISHFLMVHIDLNFFASNRAEVAILVIDLIYLPAPLFNLLLPKIGVAYLKHDTRTWALLHTFNRSV